jgi:hypothetical protein
MTRFNNLGTFQIIEESCREDDRFAELLPPP